MTHREMMSRMSSAELSEWLAYDRISPIPDSYWQTALIASTVANMLGKKRRTLEEFLPRKKGKEKKQSGPQMVSLINSIVSAVDRRNQKRNPPESQVRQKGIEKRQTGAQMIVLINAIVSAVDRRKKRRN